MFTPPPSPLPTIRQVGDPSDMTQTMNPSTEDNHIAPPKQGHRCSIKWTVVLVPLALTLVALSTRFWSHPIFLDLLLLDGNHGWTAWTKVTDWSLHEPHVAASNYLFERSAPNRFGARDTTFTPVVPANPPLPTPFPQAFDQTLSANFSTTSCYNFFLNMTRTDAFLSCRPFSLLSATSYAFSQAQDNITLMNTVLWGTCNTNPSQEQCDDNMSWFATSLLSSCETDLANRIETAVLTLNALRAYDLMRNVACTVDSSTNSYCYVEAVADSDPSKFYFYQLALGQPLGPNITMSACSRCTTELMESYASALNGTDGAILDGLSQTFNAAVGTVNEVCGTTYAMVTQVSRAGSAWVNANVPKVTSLVAIAGLVVFAGMLCH